MADSTALLLVGNRMFDDTDIWNQVGNESERVLEQTEMQKLRLTGSSPHEAAWLEIVNPPLDIELAAVKMASIQGWTPAWFEAWITQFTEHRGLINWYDRTCKLSLPEFFMEDVGLVLIVNDGRQIDWKLDVIELAHERGVTVVWIKAGPPVQVVQVKSNKERDDHETE